MKLIFAALFLFAITAHAQSPLQAQSQVYTNQFPSGPVTNAVVEGTTNKVPMQPWTVQEIEVITILRSQRAEMRVTLTNTPLLSLQTNVPAEDIGDLKRGISRLPPKPLIGPPAPPKTPKRKPRP